MKKLLFSIIFILFAVNSFAATIISPIVATANVNTANYALDASNLAAQPATYYTNASNLDAGTIGNDRVSGNYTNFTGLTCSGTVTSSIFSATTVNSTNAVITNGTVTTLGSTTGTITNLNSTSGTINTLVAPTIVSTTTISGTVLTAATATINSLVAPTLSSTTGTITNLTSTTGTINTLVAPTITSTTAISGIILTATTATINTLVAPTLTSTTGAITSLTSSGVSVNGSVTANWFVANDKVYAEMASSYNATATIIATANTYYTITANTFEVVTKNATISTANGTITVLKTGKYWVVGRISGLSATLSDAIHFGISINGAKPLGYYESEFTITATSAKGGQTCGGIINLNANDTVSTQIENVTDAHNITIKFYNLSLFRILD